MHQLGIEGRADLARRSGLSDPTLRQYMTGEPGRRGAPLPATPRADTLQPLGRALRWQSDWWDSIVAGREPVTWEDDQADALAERVAEAIRSSVVDALSKLRFDHLSKLASCAAWFLASARHEPSVELQDDARDPSWTDYVPSLDQFLDSDPTIDEVNRAANQLWLAARTRWEAAVESAQAKGRTTHLELAAEHSPDPRSIDASADRPSIGRRPSPPAEDDEHTDE